MNQKKKRPQSKLHHESTLGYCLKEANEFTKDIKDQHWKCPFCKDFVLKLPTESDQLSWIKCSEFISNHIDGHRLFVLQQASVDSLKKYEKHTKESGKRTRIWINGTMHDRGFHI